MPFPCLTLSHSFSKFRSSASSCCFRSSASSCC